MPDAMLPRRGAFGYQRAQCDQDHAWHQPAGWLAFQRPGGYFTLVCEPAEVGSRDYMAGAYG